MCTDSWNYVIFVFFFFFSRVDSSNLGGCNRMRTTISRRKSRTRPSCTRERITCVRDAHVWCGYRIQRSVARLTRCYWHVQHACECTRTRVSVARHALSPLPLCWRPFWIAEVLWFMREHEIEESQLREEAGWGMDRKVLWIRSAPKFWPRKRNKERKLSVFTPTPLSNVFLYTFWHTCNLWP